MKHNKKSNGCANTRMKEELKQILDDTEASIQNPYRLFDFSRWPRCTSNSCPSLAQWTADSGCAKTKKNKANKRKKSSVGNSAFNDKSSWIHRPEKSGECKCDYNPHCLVSLGVFPPQDIDTVTDKDRHEKVGVIDSDSPIPTLDDTYFSEEFQFRKVQLVPYQIVKKHLEHVIIPYCQQSNISSTEQFVAAIEIFHKSLLPEQAIPSRDADVTNAECQTVLITLPPGIKNLGATCYLNSQLQCLSLNPVFREGVISWQNMLTATSSRSTLTKITSTMSDVMQRLQKILFMMHCGSFSVISAEKLAQSLGIENDEMQDPNEFTRLLFDRMHEMFQESNVMKDLLPNIFQGTCEYVTECQNCHTRSVREEHFMELTLPILKGASSADVQSFLDAYLSNKELLTGDNQYACNLCKTKCDASREIHLRSVPPVLNLQLSRYVFDLRTFTKHKTLAKVRLPSTISIPLETSGEKCSPTTATSTPTRLNSKRRRLNEQGNSKNNNINTNSKLDRKEYILCGVLKHQGNSANSGHYISEAMDWATGTWFQFNDENVTFLVSGPRHIFDRETSGFSSEVKECPYKQSKSRKGKVCLAGKQSLGCSDAYSLFYVERSYLAQHGAMQIIQTRNSLPNNDLISWIEKKRTMHSILVSESIETKSKVHSFINDKREFLESLFMKHGKNIDVSEWSPKDEKEDFVWIDGSWFRRYLEQALSLPTPANQTSPSFPLPSIDAVGLCEHQVGLNPSNAHKGKWIRRSVFDAIEQFHLEKKRTLVNDINEGHNFEPVVLRSNFQCGICVETYCKRLHEKLCLVRNIVEVCDLLDVPVSNNVEPTCFYVSKTFLTDFRKRVDRLYKQALKCNAIDACNLDDVISIPEELNSSIVCHHGKLRTNGNVDRVAQVVSHSAWDLLSTLFPRAIELQVSSSRSDDSIHCAQCLNIKYISMARRDDLKKWANETLDDEACKEVQDRENAECFKFFKDNEEIHILSQKCLNDWRDLVDQSFRTGSFAGRKTELLSPSQLRCQHKKLRLPMQLQDALMGKQQHSAVFDDDSDANIHYECLTKSQLESIQTRISSLNKLIISSINDELKSEKEFWFKGLNSHAKVVCNKTIVNSSKKTIYDAYSFDPELCQICSDKSGSERKILLNFVALESDEEIPSLSHSEFSRTRRPSRLPKKRSELKMAANDCLAKLRLLLFEQAGFSPLGQKLTLAQHSRELPYLSNDLSLENLGIVNGDIIYVQNLFLMDGSGMKKGSSLSRRSKKEMENEILEALLDIHIAYERRNGRSNSDPLKIEYGHSLERGFSGTLLESSKAGNDVSSEISSAVLRVNLHGRDQAISERKKNSNKDEPRFDRADFESKCDNDQSSAERSSQSNIEARYSSILELSRCSREALMTQNVSSSSSIESRESIISISSHDSSESKLRTSYDGGSFIKPFSHECALSFILLEPDHIFSDAVSSSLRNENIKLQCSVDDSLSKVLYFLSKKIGCFPYKSDFILSKDNVVLPTSTGGVSLADLNIKNGDIIHVKVPLPVAEMRMMTSIHLNIKMCNKNGR